MELTAAQALWSPDPGWLNTASYGLPAQPTVDAVLAAQESWRRGLTSWEPWGECTEQAREIFARLVNVRSTDVCIGATASGLIAPIAAAVPDGARVLVPDVEFTSNVFPWAAHAARGVEVVAVAPEKLPEAIDERTHTVAYSLVQSSDGSIAPDEQIVAAARAYGAEIVVDATQACGWLPVDASRYDALVCHTYKWLMSPRGASLAYLSPALRERLTPLSAGWYAGADVHSSYYGLPLRLAEDARRFDTSPDWFAWVGAAPALALVEAVGVETINAYDVGLANRFLAGLGHKPGNSAIVCVDVEGAGEKLKAAGIRTAVRAGRVRASFHLYTTEAEVDAAVAALTN